MQVHEFVVEMCENKFRAYNREWFNKILISKCIYHSVEPQLVNNEGISERMDAISVAIRDELAYYEAQMSALNLPLWTCNDPVHRRHAISVHEKYERLINSYYHTIHDILAHNYDNNTFAIKYESLRDDLISAKRFRAEWSAFPLMEGCMLRINESRANHNQYCLSDVFKAEYARALQE